MRPIWVPLRPYILVWILCSGGPPDGQPRRAQAAQGCRVPSPLAQDGTWQSDTFGTKRQALRFQCDVEDAGNRWPAGWVPGYGYSAEPAPDASAEASFSEVASRYLLALDFGAELPDGPVRGHGCPARGDLRRDCRRRRRADPRLRPRLPVAWRLGLRR